MIDSDKFPCISRRFVLTGFGAVMAFSGVGSPGFASGGGGGGGDTESNSHSISNDPPPAKRKKGEKTRVMLTQAKYHRMSTKGLKTAIKGIDNGHDYWIEGFTKKMSRNIFEMTLLDRKRTLYTFKKMRKLKSKKKRQKFLWDIEYRLDSEIIGVNQDIKPRTLGEILFDDGKESIDKLKKKRKKLKAYRNLLRRWVKKPMEGTLPVD